MRNSSQVRAKSAAINNVAVMTKSVEYAFVAAGATIALIAVLQSMRILVSWI